MIYLNNVCVVYGGNVHALKNVSLGFAKGEISVLLGTSGAGKSTLLRCLNGFVEPSAGHVTVDGIGQLKLSNIRGLRQRTGMIFQQHQLIGRLSVMRNVLIGRLGQYGTLRSMFPFSRADKLVALECIHRVGLLDKAVQRVDQLSGGQQQRVGIARAFAQRPDIVLADEPVASLDPATAESVLSLLYEMCRSDGITAVVSLHQVNLAKKYADRIIGVSGGTIVFDGSPTELDEVKLSKIYPRNFFHSFSASCQDNEENILHANDLAFAC